MIAALLLAAGRSTRFGDDKLCALLRGRPVVRWSTEAVSDAADVTCVVTSPGAAGIRDALLGLTITLVENAARDDGMSSSIRAGVAALPPDVDAVVVALGDQPLVSSAVVSRVCDAWRASRAPAVAPRYRGARGHPVLFDRACFAGLAALQGDAGARGLLESLGARVLHVDVDDDAPLDVDTPAALRAVADQLAARGA